jgi:hypothetical protein
LGPYNIDGVLTQFPVPTTQSSGSSVEGETPSGSCNGSNEIFTLAHTPVTGSVGVTLSGVRLNALNDYSISGSTITMNVAPISSDWVLVDYRY